MAQTPLCDLFLFSLCHRPKLKLNAYLYTVSQNKFLKVFSVEIFIKALQKIVDTEQTTNKAVVSFAIAGMKCVLGWADLF